MRPLKLLRTLGAGPALADLVRSGYHADNWGIRVSYLIQAIGVSGSPVSAVVDDDAKEALAIAVEWATEGRTEIRILAGSQVYTAEDFAAAIVIRDFGSSAANGPCVLAAASLRRLETIGTAGRFHAMSGQWTERLQCPRCGASGLAQLFQADDEDTPRVVAVEGFIATPTTSGVPMFRCTNCGSLAKP